MALELGHRHGRGVQSAYLHCRILPVAQVAEPERRAVAAIGQMGFQDGCLLQQGSTPRNATRA